MADVAATRIPGPERAAILLMSLGEAEAAEVLKHMGAKDVQKVGTAMATLSNVSRERAAGVLGEFCATLNEQTSLGVGAEDYVRTVLKNALGEDKAGSLIDRILLGRNSKGLDALKWMDTRQVAELIRNEHPQIIAIVLSYLDSDQAASILSLLPERSRAEIVMRVATLDGIQPNALRELDELMERQFAGHDNIKSSSVGGVKVAASIMNLLDSTEEQGLMTRIAELDQRLGESIQELMFVFDNLVEIDDRGIQRLLREIGGDTLALALKGAEPAVSEKLMNNMSQRAAEILREDMETKGPVRLADVEGAQKEILNVARRLADDGEIMLGGGGETYV